MTTKDEALKPCPFCGGPVSLERATDTYDDLYGRREWWGVVCRNTLNRGGTCAIQQRPSASKEAAIDRWNMRTPTAPVQEPVAIALNTGTKQGVKWLKNVEHGEKRYTTLPAAPVQEPVAWFKHGPYEDGEPLSVVFENPNDDVCYSPLGFIDTPPAAQRQWAGLTQDEFRDFATTLDYGTGGLIRAIEAKLKAKNSP